MENEQKLNWAIFASGNGTNAEKIIQYFENHTKVNIKVILTNHDKAGVLEKAKKYGVNTLIFDKKDLYENDKVLTILKENKIDCVVLAGFLWLFPIKIIQYFESIKGKILNIHPALLPNYGGKGMYGMKVHEAIIQNQEKESGITIHEVNEKYDEGKILLQVKCAISKEDTPESLANKIHQLEYEYLPKTIEIESLKIIQQ
jgi:phosphoribosylglycinamide formyltransferase-1